MCTIIIKWKAPQYLAYFPIQAEINKYVHKTAYFNLF